MNSNKKMDVDVNFGLRRFISPCRRRKTAVKRQSSHRRVTSPAKEILNWSSWNKRATPVCWTAAKHWLTKLVSITLPSWTCRWVASFTNSVCRFSSLDSDLELIVHPLTSVSGLESDGQGFTGVRGGNVENPARHQGQLHQVRRQTAGNHRQLCRWTIR